MEVSSEKELGRFRELGLPENPPAHMPISRERLREKIASGMQSLREGKGLDGETAMAELMSGLDESDSARSR